MAIYRDHHLRKLFIFISILILVSGRDASIKLPQSATLANESAASSFHLLFQFSNSTQFPPREQGDWQLKIYVYALLANFLTK